MAKISTTDKVIVGGALVGGALLLFLAWEAYQAIKKKAQEVGSTTLNALSDAASPTSPAAVLDMADAPEWAQNPVLFPIFQFFGSLFGFAAGTPPTGPKAPTVNDPSLNVGVFPVPPPTVFGSGTSSSPATIDSLDDPGTGVVAVPDTTGDQNAFMGF